MTGKDNLKSARKKFMVMKTKQAVFGLFNTPDEEINTKLSELETSLGKVFGDKEAVEIIEAAIDAADKQFSLSLQQVMVDSAKDAQE